MRALVIGGTGFIGGAICQELKHRQDFVRVMDRFPRELPFQVDDVVAADMMDAEALKAAMDGMDEVYHIAGVLGTTELLTQVDKAIDLNIKATFKVLEVAKELGVSRVFYPTKPNEWHNLYSLTKKAAEEACVIYREYFDLDTRVMRWLNAYGPRQKLSPVRKAVPVMIACALEGVPIPVYGDGSQLVELEYVDDVAKATVELMRMDPAPAEPVLDAGVGIRLSVRQMAELIKGATQSQSEIVYGPMRAGEPESDKSRWGSYESVFKYAWWLRRTPLSSGLAHTVKYYQKLTSAERQKALEFHGLMTALRDAA